MNVTFNNNNVISVNHGLVINDCVQFSTTGSLPSTINSNYKYHVVSVTTDTFQIVLKAGDTNIVLSGGSGVHTVEVINSFFDNSVVITSNPNSKVVIFCHGAYGAADNAAVTENSAYWDTSTNIYIKNALLNAGFNIIDCNGCDPEIDTTGGNDMGPENLGSPNAVKSYRQAYEYVKSKYSLTSSEVYVVGFSMGGLSAINFCRHSGLNIAKLALIAPVTGVKFHAWDNYWGSQTKRRVAKAYNFDCAYLPILVYEAEKVGDYDPLVSSSLNNLPIKIWQGTADVNVPLVYVEAFVTAWSDADITLETRSGETHTTVRNTVVGTELVSFFNQ